MLGIQNIAAYIPSARLKNFDFMEKFEVDEHFIKNKLGFIERSFKDKSEETSDLCVKAYTELQKKDKIDNDEIDVVIVVTQNPDYSLPHTSAVLHDKLNLPDRCACFDISLGCSGFVYGLSVIINFMKGNSFEKGLLFTCDPYSKVIDTKDKNTSMLFGDAATVTLIGSDHPIYIPQKFTFGTIGKQHDALIVKDKKLSMSGRTIFNFAATEIPKDIDRLLDRNSCTKEEIDFFVLHPGSRYIVDTLIRRIGIPINKIKFGAENYGNTVSSSIPLLLEEHVRDRKYHRLLISGFGVGLSWSSTILSQGK